MTKPSTQRHSTSLLVPSNERRKSRRKRVKAERALEIAAKNERTVQERARAQTEKAERRNAPHIPASGESGPAAGRNHRPLRVQAHRATSATLAAAYPFLAEAGLGGEGVLIGTDAFSRRSLVFDPWVLYERQVITNPNISLVGEIGTGKSSLLKSLVTRSLNFGRKAYNAGDPKGEWTPVARAVGGLAIELGPGLATRINPLDAGHRPPTLDADVWRQEVRLRQLELLGALIETLNGRESTAIERTAIAAALDAATTTSVEPTLPQVVHNILNPDPAGPLPAGVVDTAQLLDDGRAAGHALARLVDGDLMGLFDRESSVTFDTSAPMVSIDVSRIGEDNPLIPLVMTCTSSWMESALRDPSGGNRWMIYDEAWKLLRYPALVRRMETQWRLSRAWGLANALALHQMADYDAVGDLGSEARARAKSLLALTSTRIVYRQPADQLSTTAEAMGLNRTEVDMLPSLVRGRGLWRIGTRGFVVQHMLTPQEMDVFDTDARMIGHPA